MIDIDALEKAVAWMESLPSMEVSLNKHEKVFIQAARLVLVAVPTHHAVAAAVNGMMLEDPLPMEMFEPNEREELARAALTAAGIHNRERMPTRKEIAKVIAKRDGSPYGNYENYLGDADRILALLGDTA